MIPDVFHLQMVQAIHEEGTLTGASRRLYLSQPALSRQLDKLERRIGATLFRRHHAGMSLTQEGRRLLESAERVLGELARAEHDVRALARGDAGSLRLATECYMCYHWLPWVARAFGARFPGVELQLAPEATRDPYGALASSTVDMALVYSAPPAPAGVARTEVFQDELVALVASGHALAGEAHLTPQSLAAETLICHYAEPDTGVLERAFLAPAGVRPRRTMEMHVTPAVVEMARAGYGVAVVPRWILGGQGSLEGLVVLPLGEGGLWRSWYAASAASRADEPVLGSMIQVLREELGRAMGVDGGPAKRHIRLA
ncbi:MAG TPA: LysR substrate-binding domain-containing protein [Longimicrobium sp.]|nr:LysR substrate-binding domain-containing protein [Longimicrobium sp.]